MLADMTIFKTSKTLAGATTLVHVNTKRFTFWSCTDATIQDTLVRSSSLAADNSITLRSSSGYTIDVPDSILNFL